MAKNFLLADRCAKNVYLADIFMQELAEGHQRFCLGLSPIFQNQEAPDHNFVRVFF